MSKRSSFYFPEAAAAVLYKIRKRSRLESNADVVRAALGSYDALLDVSLDGGVIVILDKTGKEWPYSPYVQFYYPGLEHPSNYAEIARSDEKIPKNFVFSEEAAAKLASIKERSGSPSNADVIRAALTAFDELVCVMSAGDRILIRYRDGRERNYIPYAPLVRLSLAANSADLLEVIGVESSRPDRRLRAQPSSDQSP